MNKSGVLSYFLCVEHNKTVNIITFVWLRKFIIKQ